MKRFRNQKTVLLVYTLGLLTGASLIFCVHDLYSPPVVLKRPLEKRLGAKEWVNPLLECRVPSEDLMDHELNSKIVTLAAKAKKDFNIDSAVIIRDYTTSAWAALNQEEKIAPGSIRKVALLFAFLKRSEKERDLLERRVTFSDPGLLRFYDVQSIKPSRRLQLGKTYKINELLEAAIRYSDNVAAVLLEDYDNHIWLQKIAQEIDIPLHEGTPPNRILSLRETSSLFKILYNASYLGQTQSNFALKLLSQSEFKDGLRSSIPANVPVASKFGESILGKSYFLSECGIVYLNSHNYLICVSLSSPSQEKLIPTLQEYSAVAFEHFSKMSVAGDL